MSRSSKHVAVASVLALPFVACGSRGPLDIEVIEVNPDATAPDLDASTTDAAYSADASADAPLDAPPDHKPGPLDCVTCIQQQCGADIVACVQDPACQATLQCVFTKCITGGTADPQCLLNCAGGDPAKLYSIFKILQCIGTKCGPDCKGVIPGGGGGDGG